MFTSKDLKTKELVRERERHSHTVLNSSLLPVNVKRYKFLDKFYTCYSEVIDTGINEGQVIKQEGGFPCPFLNIKWNIVVMQLCLRSVTNFAI